LKAISKSNIGATNSILSKIDTKSPLPLSLSLLFAKTVPILMYSMEAVSMSKHDTTNLSNVFNSMFFKLFGTFNKMIIEQFQYYCGYYIQLGPESTSQFLLCYVGNVAFEQLLADFNINVYTSKININKLMWTHFKNKITIDSWMIEPLSS